MKILVLNCGSSSVKYQLIEIAEETELLAKGLLDRIGLPTSELAHQVPGREKYKKVQEVPDHQVGINLILKTLVDPEIGVIRDQKEIDAVGHRVAHGGETFKTSARITPEGKKEIEKLIELAPLHNPANLIGVEAAQAVLSGVPQCAVMDTAWHQTMPASSYMYALPREWYEKYMVRRYGFHGTSFLYNAKRAAVLLGKDPFETNLIIAHIGNGSSINAVKNGCSFDTSMGLTPLEGLVMGTRSGDIDAGIIFHIMRKTGMTAAEIEKKLNKESGVLGLTTKWADRRDVETAAEKGDPVAILTQQVEAYRIKKYIGAYYAALGHVDALVFTAGVGEMGPEIRKLATEGLVELGIVIDEKKNALAKCRNSELEITGPGSKVRVFVIPTDEELVMTEDTVALINGTYDVHTNYHYSFENRGYVNKARAEGLQRDLEKKPWLKDIVAKLP